MAKKLPVAVTTEEFVNLVKNTIKDTHKLSFLLAWGSGLRISEIVGGKRKDGSLIPPLTKDKIDLKEKTIMVKQGKGKKDRVVPLPKGFKQTHLSLLPIKLTSRALEKAFLKAAEKSGLRKTKQDVHFHSLRHGFGSHLANQGVPVHHIRTLMGHSNISTTNTYLELNPKEALKSYEQLF